MLRWLIGGGLAAVVGTTAAESQDDVGAMTATQAARDLRGEAADKPDPASVPVHSTYWSLDTGDFEYSDGAKWKVVAV
jgi:hypothetical protein